MLCCRQTGRRIFARAVTAMPPNISHSFPPFLSPFKPFKSRRRRRRSLSLSLSLPLSASSVSLSEEECKNSLGALSKLSRTPAHPAAALLPSPLGRPVGPPGLVCLDRVELTSDAPRPLRLLQGLPSCQHTDRGPKEARGAAAGAGAGGELTIEEASSWLAAMAAVSRGIRDER